MTAAAAMGGWHSDTTAAGPPGKRPLPVLMADILNARCDRPDLLRFWDTDRARLGDLPAFSPGSGGNDRRGRG